MNKRTFFKLMALTMSNRVMSPMFAWAAGDRLKNWAGNLEYSTDRLFKANSMEQVRDYVKKEAKFRVLGTRHCFNTIADSTHNLLSLRAMDQVVTLDPSARTVTVGPGITYGQLSPYLHTKGFALHNLASLPHISVAGACSTATHGSGEKNGNLATSVAAMEFLTATGETRKLSQQDGETFHGSVVGLGAMGVITSITLNIEPTFMVRQYVYENLPFDEVKNNFDAIQASGYSVSLFTDWQKPRMNEVWIKSRVEEGQSADAAPTFFGAKLATKNLHPIAELSAENCTEQMGVPGPWYERLPHFKMGFTPSAGQELQSEYFVPRQHAIDAIVAIERLHEQIHPSLLISEIRTVAADDFWMSPCYRHPCVTIHFTWKQDWPAVSKLLPQIEKELAPFHARPHWGKLFSISPQSLNAMYERLPDFVGLCSKYDPRGKLRNEFLNKNVFGA
jgi:xylitol oxidase